MQILERRVTEDKPTREILLKIQADKYCREILEATMEMPKSAIELCIECDIPISTTYRRVQLLHRNKLLEISGSISQNRKKHFLYKSKIKSIMTCFNNGSIEIEVIPNLVLENSTQNVMLWKS